MRIMPISTDQLPEALGSHIPPLSPNGGGFPKFLDRIGIGQPGSSGAAARQIHIVERGQNLWQICKRSLTGQGKNPTQAAVHRAVMTVAKSNGLRDPDFLSVGQKLDLSALNAFGEGAKALANAVKIHAKVEAIVPPAVTAGPPSRTINAAMVTAPRTMPAMPQKTQQFAMPERKPRFSMPAPSGNGKNHSAIGLPRVSSTRVPPLTPHPVRSTGSVGGRGDVASAASPVSTDITGLIQSILEPGSMDEFEGVSESPWAQVLGGPARLTSKYGMRNDPFSGRPEFHEGIDIAAKSGTNVYPSMPGKVAFSGWKPGYGKVVVVKHANGLETVYGHASKILVKAGQTVTADTPIANVGSTGRSTGPHLHYEVRKNDVPIDPLPMLTGDSLHVAQTL